MSALVLKVARADAPAPQFLDVAPVRDFHMARVFAGLYARGYLDRHDVHVAHGALRLPELTFAVACGDTLTPIEPTPIERA